MAAGDVNVNALTPITSEPTTTDSLVAVNRNTNEGQIIDYNLLADKILSKLTSKTYSGLSTTSKLLVGAINELDSDVTSLNSSLESYGSWTPVFKAGSTTLSYTNYDATGSRYFRMGRLVCLHTSVTFGTLSASGSVYLDGGSFPFAPVNAVARTRFLLGSWDTITNDGNVNSPMLLSTTNINMWLKNNGSGVAPSALSGKSIVVKVIYVCTD